jgi:hypothetical protein
VKALKPRFVASSELVAVSLWDETAVVYGIGCMYSRRKGHPLPWYLILYYDRPGASPAWTWRRGRTILPAMPGQPL